MRPLKWGIPYRRVCWLVGPGKFDHRIPPDCELEYVLTDQSGGWRARKVLLRTTDQDKARLLNATLYSRGAPPTLTTKWKRKEGGGYFEKFNKAEPADA